MKKAKTLCDEMQKQATDIMTGKAVDSSFNYKDTEDAANSGVNSAKLALEMISSLSKFETVGR